MTENRVLTERDFPIKLPGSRAIIFAERMTYSDLVNEAITHLMALAAKAPNAWLGIEDDIPGFTAFATAMKKQGRAITFHSHNMTLELDPPKVKLAETEGGQQQG